jgi:hypothetical protein
MTALNSRSEENLCLEALPSAPTFSDWLQLISESSIVAVRLLESAAMLFETSMESFRWRFQISWPGHSHVAGPISLATRNLFPGSFPRF